MKQPDGVVGRFGFDVPFATNSFFESSEDALVVRVCKTEINLRTVVVSMFFPALRFLQTRLFLIVQKSHLLL